MFEKYNLSLGLLSFMLYITSFQKICFFILCFIDISITKGQFRSYGNSMCYSLFNSQQRQDIYCKDLYPREKCIFSDHGEYQCKNNYCKKFRNINYENEIKTESGFQLNETIRDVRRKIESCHSIKAIFLQSDLCDQTNVMYVSVFKRQEYITNLTLSSICLGRIYGVFGGYFPKLEFLDLSFNKLTNLSDNVFYNLTELKELNLRDNQLCHLFRILFRDMKVLTLLDVSNNELKSLEDDTFDDLGSLEKLYLNGNSLQQLPENMFSTLNQLQVLNLEGNDFLKLSAVMFLNFQPHKKLTLSLKTSQAINTYDELKDFKDINFSLGKPKHYFDSIESKNSEVRIILNETECRNFSGETDFHLLECKTCYFKYISRTLVLHKKVEEKVNANNATIHNQLLDIELIIEEYPVSESAIVPRRWDFLPKSVVNAKRYGPQQQTVRKTAYQRPKQTIDTSSHFYNYCQIDIFAKQLLLHKLEKDLKYIVPKIMLIIPKPTTDNCPHESKYPTNEGLTFFQLACFLKNCPQQCSCSYLYTRNAFIINCQNSGLTHFPNLKDTNISVNFILHLENNSISELPNVNSNVFEKISEIYLDHNQLKSLKNYLNFGRLKKLYVQNNQLTYYELKKIKNVQLKLAGNPLNCCSFENIKHDMMNESSWIVDVLDIHCNSDLLKGKTLPLINILKDENLCSANPKPTTSHPKWNLEYPLIIGFVISVCIIIVCYIRFKRRLLHWLFYHNVCTKLVKEEDIDKKKKFDAFVSYSCEDAEWVANVLVPGLENESPAYKLCLHQRNWLGGEWITELIVKSVEQSRRTIIILTDNFARSSWSRLEFIAAYQQMRKDNVKRIIIVVPFELPDLSLLDSDLRMFIQMNTYIKWNQPCFWMKLRSSMPYVRKRKHAAENTSTFL